MFYLHDVTQELNYGADTAQNAPSDDDGVLDDDCDDFGSIASSELQEEVYEEPSSPRPHNVQPSDIELAPPAFGLPHVVEAVDSTQMAAISTNEEIKPPRWKSIAHFDLTNNKVVFLSLDLETGGEYCGIIQLDNWYTTMSLAYHLYNRYGYFFCGTMVPTDKKARQDMDVPFLKLSNGAKDKVERGWFREACVQRGLY